MLSPSGAEWLRKMILPLIPGGCAAPGSGLSAKPPNAGVTIAILGDYRGSLCTVVRGTVLGCYVLDVLL